MKELTVKDIRSALAQLRSVSIRGDITMNMRADIHLTVSGVVWIPGVGFMHPNTFREYAGEEAYQWLLEQPRIVTSYDEGPDD